MDAWWEEDVMRAAKRQAMLETSNKPINIKYHNQRLILSLFRQTGTLSTAELSVRTDLSKTTVAKILNEFEKKGLILAVGKGASTDVGGKKPERFAFNPSYSHIITLSITHSKAIGAVSDLKCNLSLQKEVVCDTQAAYGEAIAILARLTVELMREANLGPENLCSVILGCEGVIDAANNIIHYALYHPWGHNLRVAEDLGRLLPFPVTIRVDNNVRLAGYAHLILNPDQYGTIAVISSVHYAGGCIIDGKQLIHGQNGFVGEFGHMILEPHSDVECHCGCHGCFGALVSPETVLPLAKRRVAEYPDSSLAPAIRDGVLAMEDIFAAANQGDRFARELVDRSIHYFTLLIHNMTVLRDPVKVIIQGVYSNAGGYFLDTLRERVNSLPFYKTKHSLPISYTTIPIFNAYLIGAAYFAVDEFLGGNALYD